MTVHNQNKTELKTCPIELINLSGNQCGNSHRKPLPSTVTHPLIRVKQAFQCILQGLNIANDVINSSFLGNEEMNEIMKFIALHLFYKNYMFEMGITCKRTFLLPF